ncbi:MAG: nucleotide exchange factor GrpE [Bacilli bacterium]|nr:nucleotide exchange factor GrpE [Bacilli bacterium]
MKEHKKKVEDNALPKKKDEVMEEQVEIKKDKKDKKEVKENKELEKLKEENKTLNEKVLRISAEMQNMRRRYDDEINRICKYDGIELIKELLRVVDNFERAITLDDDNLADDLSKFLSGFKLIYADLTKILESKNVKVIDCLNKEFDPESMEAVLTESNKDLPDNTVVDVLQKGYTYNDKVIRPAMVKVNNI